MCQSMQKLRPVVQKSTSRTGEAYAAIIQLQRAEACIQWQQTRWRLVLSWIGCALRERAAMLGERERAERQAMEDGDVHISTQAENLQEAVSKTEDPEPFSRILKHGTSVRPTLQGSVDMVAAQAEAASSSNVGMTGIVPTDQRHPECSRRRLRSRRATSA